MERFPITPPGLESLVQGSQFLVNQTRTSIFQSHCTYDLLNADGFLLYHGVEVRECCGPRMEVKVCNTKGYNVLHLLMPSECCSCENRLQVSDSSGILLGYIEQKWTNFTIMDSLHQVCLTVKSPGWGQGFMSDVKYQVMSADKSVSVGLITRVWRGFRKEVLSSTNNYVVQFPEDLDITMKAMLLACTIFIDLLYHEEKRRESAAASNAAATTAATTMAL
ncbi:phospholipid scramblase 2-like [Pseudophryne corroboree]|uniref:phospholipid scramblase 2-like n=1 Tax=Pseudophryne corroboree TaxID=495146 RepID=UPI0030821A35